MPEHQVGPLAVAPERHVGNFCPKSEIADPNPLGVQDEVHDEFVMSFGDEFE